MAKDFCGTGWGPVGLTGRVEMSQIPTNAVASVAQTQVAARRRAAEDDAAREAPAREAQRQQRKHAESPEFVENMAAAAGLKVDADGRREPEAKKKGPPRPEPDQPETPPPDEDPRAQVAALLAGPEERDTPAPPPYMLDVEA